MAGSSDTTGDLCAVHKVQGTEIYNAALEKLGHLQDLMFDKVSGRVVYAILSIGGFFGFGERHYPLPWEKLKYNAELDGYIVDVPHHLLEGAPSYAAEAHWQDAAWVERIRAYYAGPELT